MRKALLCLALSLPLFSQNAAMLPDPHIRFTDSAGRPLALGKIYTCVAGTSCPGNPLATYTDSTAVTQNANPIILDAGGYASVWIGTGTYKLVAQNALGVQQWTQDNVSSVAISTGAGLSAANGASLISYTSPATGAVSRTVAAKFSDDVNVRDFGAKCDGSTDDTAAIQAAANYVLTLTYGGTVRLPDGHCVVSSLNINKGFNQGFALIGNGPHTSWLGRNLSATANGTAIINYHGQGSATHFEGFTIAGGVAHGAYPSDVTDQSSCLYINVGDGIFINNLWIGGCSYGLNFNTVVGAEVHDSVLEYNQDAIFLQKNYADQFENIQTYHNSESAIYQTGTNINPGSGLPNSAGANLFSNCGFFDDQFVGDYQNAAVVNDSATPLILDHDVFNDDDLGTLHTAVLATINAAGTYIYNSHFVYIRDNAIINNGGKLVVSGTHFDHIGYVNRSGLPSTTCITTGVSTQNADISNNFFEDCAGDAVIANGGGLSMIGNRFLGTSNGGTTGGPTSAAGLITVQVNPGQTYMDVSILSNVFAQASSVAGQIAMQLNNSPAVPSAGIVHIRGNTVQNYGTPWSTGLTATQLTAYDVDADGTSRLPGGFMSSTTGANAWDEISPSGIGHLYLRDSLTGNYNVMGFEFSPGSYGKIFTTQVNGTAFPLVLNPDASDGKTLVGTYTPNGSNAVFQVGGNISVGTGSSYAVGSNYGINATKTAGSCTFTITGGVITGVTGC